MQKLHVSYDIAVEQNPDQVAAGLKLFRAKRSIHSDLPPDQIGWFYTFTGPPSNIWLSLPPLGSPELLEASRLNFVADCVKGGVVLMCTFKGLTPVSGGFTPSIPRPVEDWMAAKWVEIVAYYKSYAERSHLEHEARQARIGEYMELDAEGLKKVVEEETAARLLLRLQSIDAHLDKLIEKTVPIIFADSLGLKHDWGRWELQQNAKANNVFLQMLTTKVSNVMPEVADILEAQEDRLKQEMFRDLPRSLGERYRKLLDESVREAVKQRASQMAATRLCELFPDMSEEEAKAIVKSKERY